jgi:hypothetical protein
MSAESTSTAALLKRPLQYRVSDALFQLIFLYVDCPAELLRTCKKLHDISKSDVVRTLWLLGRPELLAKWSRERVSKRPNKEIEWIDNITTSTSFSTLLNNQQAAFPASLLNEDVCRLFVDAIESGGVTLVLAEADTIALTRSTWSIICKSLMTSLAYEIINSHDALSPNVVRKTLNPNEELGFYEVFDEASWREAVYLAITAHDEDPQLLSALIMRPKLTGHLKNVASDAIILAARLNKVAAMKTLVDNVGYDLSKGATELMKVAAAYGNWGALLYVVGNCGFLDKHDELMSTYRGLYLLMQCAERGQLDSIDEILDTWREDSKVSATSEGMSLFAQRWTTAAEMACETGQKDLLLKLLQARKIEEKQQLGTRITSRMFALALSKDQNETADLIINQCLSEANGAPEKDDTPFTTNILAHLGSGVPADLGPSAHRYDLLKRYCIITTHDLARQIGFTTIAGTSKSWNSFVLSHRTQVIKYLIESKTYPLNLKHRFVQDSAWEAWGAQHFEVVKLLKDLGLNWDWMESATSNVDLNFATSSNATVVPDSITMMLFTALGGTVTFGDSDSTYPSPRSSNYQTPVTTLERNKRSSFNATDIGALLIAAETSKNEATRKKYTVDDYTKAASELSKDESFAAVFTPRLVINPEDKLWTAFLEGKLEKVQSGSGDVKQTLSWMEPMQSPSQSFNNFKSNSYGLIRVNSSDDAESVSQAWKDMLGGSFDGTGDGLAMFLGLGGVVPETVTKGEKKVAPAPGKNKAFQRVMADF